MASTALAGESIIQFNTILMNNIAKTSTIQNSESLDNSLNYNVYNNNQSNLNLPTSMLNAQSDNNNTSINDILANDNQVPSVSVILTIRLLMQGKV